MINISMRANLRKRKETKEAQAKLYNEKSDILKDMDMLEMGCVVTFS
jgi:hypothetical protein